MKNSIRFIVIMILILGSLLAFGTIGYFSLEEGWSISDSLYMTAITISTVGFGETHPLSLPGRMFTVVLIFAGLIAMTVVGAYAAKLLIDSELKNMFGRKKMSRDISNLSNHHIICGYGRIGSTICQDLASAGQSFVVIDKNQSLTEEAEKLDYLVIRGDATSDAILKDAGIERACGVVAVLNSDALNLFITLAARELNPEIKIVARGEEPGVESRMLRAGADVVVSPLKLGGMQIARLIAEDEDSTEKRTMASPLENMMGLTLRQFEYTEQAQKTLNELIEEVNAVAAVAVQRSDGTVENMPDISTLINPMDAVLVCVKK